MSGLFWSLFGEQDPAPPPPPPPPPPATTTTTQPADVKPTSPLNPAHRDRSFSAQFFSFFSEENHAEHADDCNEVGAISNSPVAKTLSEMAQSLSEIADETIRTFSPAPAVPPVQPGKISYRRKTVFAPTGHLTEVLESGPSQDQPSLQNLAAMNPSSNETSRTGREGGSNSIGSENSDNSSDFSHRFPSYRSVKQGKDVPLLTSLSRNRPSFKDRESTISQIATKTKTEQETPQEQFTVSNLTGLPSAGSNKLSQLASISEHDGCHSDPDPDRTPDQTPDRTPEVMSKPDESLPSVENHPGALYKYDSEDYFVSKTAEVSTKKLYTESDDDDVITADLDFEIFKLLPPTLTSDLDENIYFVNSNSSLNGDSEPLNLIDQLLELGFLTEEEKAKLQKVLAADENLQKTQYNHFVKKHKDLYNERKQCLAKTDTSVCPLCYIKFGWFTNSGDVCPVPACQLKVCNACRVAVHDSWICFLCHKEKDLKAQAGYWFQQPAKNKKRVKTGTDILKKSLDSTQYDTRKQSPSLLDIVKKEDPASPSATEVDGPQTTHNTFQFQSEDSVPPHGAEPDPPSSLPKQLEQNHVTSSTSTNHVTSQPNHVTKSEHVTPPTVQRLTEPAVAVPVAPVVQRPRDNIPVINPVPHSAPPKEPTPKYSDQTGRNLKAPHIRDIKGQSLSADSGFINDDQTKEDSGILELVSEDDDDSSTQFRRYLMARSVAPDELAPQADTPPTTPHVEKRSRPPDTAHRSNDNHPHSSSHSYHQVYFQSLFFS
ncbi:hypothetical protein ACHWQZ_G006635 [Mnemiopsis leidyi]